MKHWQLEPTTKELESLEEALADPWLKVILGLCVCRCHREAIEDFESRFGPEATVEVTPESEKHYREVCRIGEFKDLVLGYQMKEKKNESMEVIKIQPGDIVELKSGSPQMTVSSIILESSYKPSEIAEVIYFCKSKQEFVRESIPVEILIKCGL